MRTRTRMYSLKFHDMQVQDVSRKILWYGTLAAPPCLSSGRILFVFCGSRGKSFASVCLQHLFTYHRPGFKNQLMFQDVTG